MRCAKFICIARKGVLTLKKRRGRLFSFVLFSSRKFDSGRRRRGAGRDEALGPVNINKYTSRTRPPSSNARSRRLGKYLRSATPTRRNDLGQRVRGLSSSSKFCYGSKNFSSRGLSNRDPRVFSRLQLDTTPGASWSTLLHAA